MSLQTMNENTNLFMVMHFAEKFHIKQEAMNSLESVIHHLRKVLAYDKKSETIVELELLDESHSEMDVELLDVSHFNFSCISTDNNESDVAKYTFHEGLDDESHFSYTSPVDSKLVSSIADPLNWFPKAWFNDGDWIKAHSLITSDWMDWFERAWFDEVEKPHTTVAKEMEKPHNTVAKEMENPHTENDDGFAPQHSYSDTGHTVKSHTVDVDQIDNSHDWFNLIKASGGGWIKSLNLSHAVNAIKAPNSHGLDIAKGFDEVATLILDYLYGLVRCNKHPHDPGGLDPKQAPIKMEFGLLTRSTNSGLLTRNGKDVSAWNVLGPANWYDAIDGNCSSGEWGQSDRDGRWGQHHRDGIG
jgi:hypothetical protein